MLEKNKKIVSTTSICSVYQSEINKIQGRIDDLESKEEKVPKVILSVYAESAGVTIRQMLRNMIEEAKNGSIEDITRKSFIGQYGILGLIRYALTKNVLKKFTVREAVVYLKEYIKNSLSIVYFYMELNGLKTAANNLGCAITLKKNFKRKKNKLNSSDSAQCKALKSKLKAATNNLGKVNKAIDELQIKGLEGFDKFDKNKLKNSFEKLNDFNKKIKKEFTDLKKDDENIQDKIKTFAESIKNDLEKTLSQEQKRICSIQANKIIGNCKEVVMKALEAFSTFLTEQILFEKYKKYLNDQIKDKCNKK